MITFIELPELKVQLEEFTKDHPHLFLVDSEDSDIDPEEWNLMGKPFLWHKEEERDEFTLYRDMSFGAYALFNNNVLVGAHYDSWGNQTGPVIITTPGAVVVEKTYFDCDKYIWR